MSSIIFGGMTENGVPIDDMIDGYRDRMWRCTAKPDYFVRFTSWRNNKDGDLKPALALFNDKSPYEPIYGIRLSGKLDDYYDGMGFLKTEAGDLAEDFADSFDRVKKADLCHYYTGRFGSFVYDSTSFSPILDEDLVYEDYNSSGACYELDPEDYLLYAHDDPTGFDFAVTGWEVFDGKDYKVPLGYRDSIYSDCKLNDYDNPVYRVCVNVVNGVASTSIEKLDADRLLKIEPDAYEHQYQNNLAEMAYVKDLESAMSMSYVPVDQIDFVNVDKASVEKTAADLQKYRDLGFTVEPKYVSAKAEKEAEDTYE